jgi:hypothetical protein
MTNLLVLLVLPPILAMALGYIAVRRLETTPQQQGAQPHWARTTVAGQWVASFVGQHAGLVVVVVFAGLIAALSAPAVVEALRLN